MDYVTRQFIVLAKKLRKDLRKSLDVLHSDVSRLIGILSKQQANPTDAKEKPGTKDDEGEPRIIRAELSTPVPITVNNKPQDSHPNWSRAKTVVEILGIAAAIFYAYMAVRQWREMISARHQTQSAVGLAGRSADAAEAANRTAKEQFRSDQRPYVWLINNQVATVERRDIGKSALVYNQSTGQLFQNFEMTNYGKTPALRVFVRARITVGKNALQEMRQYTFPKVIPHGAPLPPGDAIFHTAIYEHTLDSATYESAIHADGGIVVFGRIDYVGLYSEPTDPPYSSDFCYLYLASPVNTTPTSGRIAFCADDAHNKMQ